MFQLRTFGPWNEAFLLPCPLSCCVSWEALGPMRVAGPAAFIAISCCPQVCINREPDYKWSRWDMKQHS